MPAARLTSQPAVVHPYDVLAQSDGATGLMLHALLCNEADVRGDVTDKTELRTFHMGPPLGAWRAACDAFGTVNLTAKQKAKIKSFIDERQEERAAERRRLFELGGHWDARSQYLVHPEATPPTPDYPLWRFNCVGFVLQAYRRAGIKLLTGPFPLKTVDDLKRLYPYAAIQLDDPDQRTALGIGVGHRWPVLLVGYVLHSLGRKVEEVNGPGAEPYCPWEGDEFFKP
jgi:hypothetical protein